MHNHERSMVNKIKIEDEQEVNMTITKVDLKKPKKIEGLHNI